MVVFNNQLYASQESIAATAAQVYRWSGSGTAWTQVNVNGFGNVDTEEAPAMAVYNNKLYCAAIDYNVGTKIFEYVSGTNWTEIQSDGFGEGLDSWTIHSMIDYNNRLYVGVTNYVIGAQVWAWNGSSWAQVNTNGFGSDNNDEIYDMVVYNDELYAPLHNATDGRIFTYNGSLWSEIVSDGFGVSGNDWMTGMGIYGDGLYALAANDNRGDPTDVQVWYSYNYIPPTPTPTPNPTPITILPETGLGKQSIIYFVLYKIL